MIGQTIPHFRIVSQLGGWMSVAGEAKDLKLQRDVVLNQFDEMKQRVPAGKK
jgi:hypothetical protein